MFGCLADKDAPAMLVELRRLGAPLWLVPPGPGAFDLAALAGDDARAFAGPDDPGFRELWTEHLAGGGVIVVCGSHALVGRLRAEVLGEAADPPGLSDPVARTRGVTRPLRWGGGFSRARSRDIVRVTSVQG